MARLNQRLKEANVFGGCGSGGESSNSNSGDTDSGPKIDPMMTVLLQHILPLVIESIAAAVGEVVRNALKPANLRHSESEQVNKLRSHTLTLKYENDRLEQYTRRESVRIVGLKEEREEDTEQKVLELLRATGVSVDASDLAAVHRTGKRGKQRHVLARFVSRRKKREVMMARKNLKDKAVAKDVSIFDDLTPLRNRLRQYLKNSGRFHRVWTKEGKIYCSKTAPPRADDDKSDNEAERDNDKQRQPTERPMVVETPDDLFLVGFDSVDYVALGLEDWSTADIDDDDSE